MLKATLASPAPLLLVPAVVQVWPEVPAGTPIWLGNLLLAIWVLGWFLDKMGKLPGGGQPEGFTKEERQAILQALADSPKNNRALEHRLEVLTEAVTELRIAVAHLRRNGSA